MRGRTRRNVFQSAAKGVGGLETLVGILGHGHEDDFVEILGKAGT